ncbi:hypothetical protein [Rhizobium sp. P44RR-XXIV]|nr:hypothetical protein [Rhizobium sp. P44RR-XXIV]
MFELLNLPADGALAEIELGGRAVKLPVSATTEKVCSVCNGGSLL